MNAMNVNRHLAKAEPGFWDTEPVAQAPTATIERGPWPLMGQLDLLCTGCHGETWDHTCWEGGISA